MQQGRRINLRERRKNCLNSRISTVSLQTKLVSGILLISLVLVGFAIMLLNQARGNFARMERIDAIHHCDDHLILAIENLAFERGRTNVVLAAATPIDSANLAFIQSRRHRVDAEIAASVERLAAIDPQLVLPLQKDYERHRQLREQVDVALNLPAAERAPTLRAEWFEMTSRFINQIRDTFALLGKREMEAGRFDHYHTYQFNAIEFRLIAGQSASVVTSALNKAGPVTPAEYETYLELRAQADYLWSRIEADTFDFASTALNAQKNRIEQAYYREYRPVQEKMLKQVMAGQSPEIQVAQLTALSVPAMDFVFDLIKQSNIEAHDATIRESEQATTKLQIAVLQFALSLVFALYILGYFHFRLFRPLQQIVLAQKSIIAGESTRFLQTEAARGDEIGLLAQGVTRLQSSMLEERRLKDMNADMAVTDRLTGLNNRQLLDREIDGLMELADRFQEPISMIVFDLDRFKNVNDKWGHPIGDEVLTRTARLASEQVRKSDLLIRLGGEEFLIVLPRTGVTAAVITAEKIRTIMETTPHLTAGIVTASFGVAERNRAESFKSWYKRCDEALYQAKQTGRNRVTACTEDSLPVAAVHVEWMPEWESGHAEIDEQHKALVEDAHRLMSIALLRRQDPAKIIPLLDQLLEHLVQHFACEETILKEIGFDQTDAHATEHRQLVAKALRLKTVYQQGEIKPSAFISFIVDDVIIGHMIKEDARYFSLTRKQDCDSLWQKQGEQKDSAN
jgi:diguanylate cyclase (GGDEF)-like protein/hemerythrin-like metal-binding protein